VHSPVAVQVITRHVARQTLTTFSPDTPSRRAGAATLGRVLAVLAVAALAAPASASAAESRDQQRCLNTLSRLGTLVVREQTEAGAACIDRMARGTSTALPAPDCPSDDTGGRVARRVRELEAKDAALCRVAAGRLPDFGYAGAASIAAAARDEAAGVVTDLLGTTPSRSIAHRAGDPAGARCQLTVLRETDRLVGALWVHALGVIKDALRGAGATAAVGSAAALRDAVVAQVEAYHAGTIAAAVTRLAASAQRQCGAAAPLAALFPGRCAAAASPAVLARCAEGVARTRFYRSLGAFHRLTVGCDLVDNGVADLSCDAPDLYEHVLDRTGYGADAYARTRIAELGVRGYIEEQLHPETIPNTALDALLARFPSLGMDFNELRTNYPGPGAPGQPRIGDVLKELQRAKILRAVASRRQLEEVLADFWFNHFNVLAVDRRMYDISPYERLAIRPYVLGRFRDLLIATARSPAMGDYLDNRQNRAGGINENYARELMELQTIGVDGGFSEADVVEVARALTGWRDDWFAPDGFVFVAAWHDFDAKTIMDLQMPPGRGYEDGAALIDFLATHPRTAQVVCRKLVTRFVADDPPQALVSAAANTFLATGGDLRAVMATILLSPEFLDRPEYRQAKVKRPLHFLASVARATGADPARLDLDAMRTSARDMGEELFKATPPTGYPETSDSWSGPGGMILRINEIDRVVARADGYAFEFPVRAGETATIVDALVETLFVAGVSDATRAAAIAFVDALPLADDDTRVEQAAAMLLASPEFLRQ
jgi:hypothetical protein